MRSARRFWAIGAVVWLLSGAARVQAGDRPLEILFVNMSPTGSGDSSSACVTTLRRALRRDPEQTAVREMRESAVRALLQRPASSDRDYLAWDASLLRHGVEDIDMVVLVDCRPDETRLDLLVVSPSSRRTRMQLRGAPDTPRLRALADSILQLGALGFAQ